jgi:nitrogen regulatory protein PII 2
MKKIIAIIRNECVETSRAALTKLGVAGVAILRVREKIPACMPEPLCSSRPGDSPDIFRKPAGTGRKKLVLGPGVPEPGQGFHLRGMLIMVVGDEAVLPVISALIAVNGSGRHGDGKIFVCPMVTSLDIRNSECAGSALS